jgi:hypothetical protein
MVAVNQSRRSGRKTRAACLRISRSAGQPFGVIKVSLLVLRVSLLFFDVFCDIPITRVKKSSAATSCVWNLRVLALGNAN